MMRLGWYLAIGITLAPLWGKGRIVEDGIFSVYANNRVEKIPNYVTEDFLLLSYSLILRTSISTYEKEQAYPMLTSAVTALANRAATAGSGEAEVANLRFLSVIRHLLEGSEGGASESEVTAELARIRSADTVGKSALLRQTIDYTQVRPRGHYTSSPELSRYFQAVRYAGIAAFYVQESAATGIDAATADRLTGQAVLLSKWTREDPKLRQQMAQYEDRRSWLFGPSEDLTSDDLLQVAAETPEGTPAEWRKILLQRARKSGRQPSIFNAVIDTQKLEPGLDARDALTAWRFLPGGFTPDGAAAQHLVYNRVGRYLGAGKPVSLTTVNGLPVKGFPLGMEIMSLLGSKEASRRLKAAGETNYEGYAKARGEAGRQIARPAGFAGEHLSLISSWVSGTEGDAAARLQTGLAFWALYRHDSLLYAKQSYTSTGKGITLPDDRNSAWLEPAADLYLRLRRLSALVESHLNSAAFAAFSEVLDECIRIADDERAGRQLTSSQVSFLNGIDRQLLSLTGGPDLPVAVDVHTDLNSNQVLVEGLRYPVPVTRGPGQRGARFRVAEFKQALPDRITDERWQEMLQKEEARK